MKPELQDALFARYPELFKTKDSPDSLVGAFGLEVGDGWYDLLDVLFSQLQSHDVTLAQVKEKYGRLRVYLDSYPESRDAIDAIIETCETLSGRICENCGNKGKIRGKGWLVTLCDSCSAKERASWT